MPYYPKSRIITDQKANPGELTTLDGKEYIGDYYITFNGKYFTGKNPQSNTNYPLQKVEVRSQQNTISITTKDTQIFDKLNQNNININSLLEPQPFYPIPSLQDYQQGKITRYFAKQRVIRMFKIIEIDQPTYDDILNQKGVYNYPLWKVTSLFWQISGPLEDERPNGSVVRAGVIDTNKRIVDTKEKTFQGIKQYLTNFQQFYKP